jgi:hypothetical protein
MASQGVRLPWRDQRLDLGPEWVGYPPTIVGDYESHGSSSFGHLVTSLMEYPRRILVTPYWDRL